MGEKWESVQPRCCDVIQEVCEGEWWVEVETGRGVVGASPILAKLYPKIVMIT
jgi:hypothetical protein